MNELETEILKYEKIICIIVSNYEKNYREDLKQELIFFLYLGLRDKLFDHAFKKNHYIYISLKNKAAKLMRNENIRRNKILSLDEINPMNEQPYLDYICDNGYQKEIYKKKDIISVDDLKKIIEKICSKDESTLLNYYFIEKINQKNLANHYGISQQAISKKISRLSTKINDYISKSYEE